ncbi:MAG: single-stranded DNA-binding protein [Verrucomicrobiota bacterium]
MNHSVISGNLTSDIETIQAGEHSIAKFSIACNQGERADFIPIEAWNMDHLADHIGKGSKVLVSGAIRQQQWESKEGQKRSRLVLKAFQVEFLDPAKSPERENAKRSDGGRSRRRAA